MVESTLFIGTIIAGITQWIKLVTPDEVSGHWIVPIAALVGVAIALVDTNIGVADISVAQGVMVGFGAAGVVAVAQNINGSA